jgi:hypothetical protein
MLAGSIGAIMQIAYVVDDLDQAIDHWTCKLGVGPFFVRRHVEYQDFSYRGAPSPADVSLAFAYSGETQIELVQQHNDAPSVFGDFVRAHGYGLQHIGVLSDDLYADVARLAKEKIRPVQRCLNANGVETLFFDTDRHPGAMLELIQASPELDAAFAFMKQAAAGWAGDDPVRG